MASDDDVVLLDTKIMLRLRSRAANHRVEVSPHASVGGVKAAFSVETGVPPGGVALSTTPGGPPLPDGASLSSLGISHGGQLVVAVPASAVFKPPPPTPTPGASVTFRRDGSIAPPKPGPPAPPPARSPRGATTGWAGRARTACPPRMRIWRR